MERKNVSQIVLFIFLSLSLLIDASAAPPVNGQNDCGLIQSGVYYSDAYPPPGMPATSGSCGWVKTSGTICATRNYGGTNYNLYPHTYICSLPIDNNIFLFVGMSMAVAFLLSRKPVETKMSKVVKNDQE